MRRTTARLVELILSALFGALLFSSHVALAALPNIEIVSLLIIVWTRVFRTGALPGIAIYILLEGLFYGFGIWWVSYLYIWFILWGIVMLIPRRPLPETSRSYALHSFGWALLSGVYGFSFGALTAIPWLITGGPKTALAYWLSGIVFDVPHAIGNFVAALVLALPLMAVLTRLRSKLHTN
ncbi:MAG: hypothetical protein IKL84_02055 [Clostridia bacterium]|nr:hypothetical protein [Clostridia bacterium]